MLYRNGHRISSQSLNGHMISAMWLNGNLIWQSVNSCFGSGHWINEKPWVNSDAWRNE